MECPQLQTQFACQSVLHNVGSCALKLSKDISLRDAKHDVEDRHAFGVEIFLLKLVNPILNIILAGLFF